MVISDKRSYLCSIYLFIYLSICLSIYLSICLSIYLLEADCLPNQIFLSNCNEDNSSHKGLHVFQHWKNRNICSINPMTNNSTLHIKNFSVLDLSLNIFSLNLSICYQSYQELNYYFRIEGFHFVLTHLINFVP